MTDEQTPPSEIAGLLESVAREVVAIHKQFGMYGFDLNRCDIATDQIIALLSPALEAKERMRDHAVRALRLYPEWCKGWGLDRNMRMATEVANECADMLAILPDWLPDDDEHAGCAIAAEIRARAALQPATKETHDGE